MRGLDGAPLGHPLLLHQQYRASIKKLWSRMSVTDEGGNGVKLGRQPVDRIYDEILFRYRVVKFARRSAIVLTRVQ